MQNRLEDDRVILKFETEAEIENRIEFDCRAVEGKFIEVY
jgi:hypothetical protein